MIILLTIGLLWTNLDIPSCILAVGIYSPYYIGQKAAIYAVFYCPSKIINTGLFPVKSFMVGCFRRLRSAVPMYGTVNLIQPASKKFTVVRGGFKSYIGETTMISYAKKLVNAVSQNPSHSPQNRTTQHHYVGVAI